MHSPAHYRRLRSSNVRAFCKHGCKLCAASLLCPGPAAAFHGTGGLPARVPNAHCVLRDVPGSELIEFPLRDSSKATIAQRFNSAEQKCSSAEILSNKSSVTMTV